ncbi:hypothetical protein ABXS75_08325 [Roseburia hominis]
MSQTVIVFQDEAILAAGGREGVKPQIQEIYKIELSGYGDPFARWRSGLALLRERAGELNKVRLVLPSSMCQVKSVQLPFAKGKELDAMAKRELQESLKSEIMDYAVIQSDPKKGVSLVGASVERDILKQFLTMCRELEIEVSGVTSPMEGIQRVIGEQKESRGRTAIFLFFEEEGLTSILMENGQYKYSGRNRLFAEPGTLDFGTEILRNVSGILQFQTASKSDAVITDLYYAGCKSEDFEVSLEELGALNLSVHYFGELPDVRMPQGERTSDWLLCIGAMMCGIRGRRSMNLAAFYAGEESEAADSRKGIIKQILPVAGVFAVCAVILAIVMIRHLSLEQKIHKKEEWIRETADSGQYQEAVTAEQKAQEIEQTIREIEQLKKNLATYPEFNNETLADIERAGGGISLKIRSYDADSGVLTFDASSRDVIDIPGYIMNLEGTKLFHKVEYTGYTYQDGVYTLSLVCIMDGPQTGGAE